MKNPGRGLPAGFALAMLLLLLLTEFLAPRLRPVFDDLFIFTENAFVRDRDFGKIWSTLYWDGGAATIRSTENIQRPLFLTLVALFGGKFFFLRMLALLAHFTLGYLLAFRLAERERLPAWAAAFFGALFLFHPAGVEAATQVVGLQELMPGLLGLCAFLWLGTPKSLLGAALIATAPGWKETGYIWLAAYLVATARKAGKERWIALAALASWLAHRLWVGGSLTQFREPPSPLSNPLVAMSGFDRLEMQLSLIGHHIRLLFSPFNLSADYSQGTLPAPGSPHALLWAIGGAFSIPLILVALKRTRSWPAAAALLSGLPSLHVFGATGMIFAERFGQLPRWGALYLLGAALASSGRLAKTKPVGLAAGAAALLALSYGLMLKRQTEWREPRSLFAADSARYPANPKLHYSLGNAFANAEEWEKARGEFERALVLYPDYAQARQRLQLVDEKLRAKNVHVN